MKNMRIEISIEYQKACARLDDALMRWIAVSADMQALTDSALPVVSAVIVPAMREGGLPEITLVVDGREQEAGGWVVLRAERAADGAQKIELFHAQRGRRLTVNVREV